MITLKSRVVTPLGDSGGGNKFTSDYLTSSSSSPFSNRLYFTGVGQRPTTSTSFYPKGRLLASSSVERLNRSDSPPPAFRGGSSWDLRSSSPMRRPHHQPPPSATSMHRHPSVDRLRRLDPHSSYRSISRDELNSIDSTISTGLHPSSTMERRNMIISNFHRNLPPTGLSSASSSFIHSHHGHHPNLHPRSNFAASRNNLSSGSSSSSTSSSTSARSHWPTSGLEFFRPRIRDRPSLASIKTTLKGKQLKPSPGSSSRYIKPTPSTSLSTAPSDANLRLSRYRHVIKFREFHIDEPLTKRKASISWDLPLETISSSSSYNSKSSGNSQSSPYSPVSRQSTPEPTPTRTIDDNQTKSSSSPQPLINRKGSVSRSSDHHRSSKLKIPKLEITPDSMSPENQLSSPDVIELPKPVSPLRVHFEVSISRLEFIPVSTDQTNQESNSFEVNVIIPLKSASKSPDPSMPKSQLVDSNKSILTNQQQNIVKKPSASPKITCSPPQTPPTTTTTLFTPSSTRMLPTPPPPPLSSLSMTISPKNESDKCSSVLPPPPPTPTTTTLSSSSSSSSSSQSPLKLPKGRTKPPSDKDHRPPPSRPLVSGKHHRKPSSPDLTRTSPSPSVDSPISSRPPSPSPTFISSIEEKSRKILSKSKSGSTSPNLTGSMTNLHTNSKQQQQPSPQQSTNESGIIKPNSLSPPSTSSVRSVVSPRQELKQAKATTSSSGINLSSTNSSPSSLSSSSSTSVPGKTTTATPPPPVSSSTLSYLSSSSSQATSSSVTEAKCKGLKDPEETKKRSLTPNQPNNRSSSPNLPLALSSSPSTPVNQANSVSLDSPKIEPTSSKKISPPITSSCSSPMAKPSTDKLKLNLNLPNASKSSSISPKSTSPIINSKTSKNQINSKSISCPPTPTETLPSYVVKVKTSSTGTKGIADKQIKSSTTVKTTIKGSTDNVMESSSSPKVLSPSSTINPFTSKLAKKSTDSSPTNKQSRSGSTSPSIKSGKSSSLIDNKVESTSSTKLSTKSTNSETDKSKNKIKSQSKEKKIKNLTDQIIGSTVSNDQSEISSTDEQLIKSSSSKSSNEKVKSDLKSIDSNQGKLTIESIGKPRDEVKVDKSMKISRKSSVKGKPEESKVKEETIKSQLPIKNQESGKNQINQQNSTSNDADRITKLLVNGGNSEEPSIDDNQKKERKRIRFRTYTMEDFELRKVLGRGSFGKVYLAQLKGHHDVFFAIKFLKKHVVIEDDDLESIMVERKVLALGVKHPFICKLFCTFQTRGMVCFVMEFLAGGDLMFHVQSCGRFSEDRARFYAAEIVSALNFLHSRYIIYRDLKLDNILLDSEGHIRLVDFGMCQCHIWKEECLPSNFCGTPEYMAPEIIKGVQYNQAVDWWSFGVLLYEMIVGDSPFKATDEDELLWNVCYEKVRIPLFVSSSAQSIILNLLEHDPAERLGMPTSSKGDIKSQKFFETINWDAINSGKVKPPFLPTLKHSADTCYFDREFTEMRPVLTPIDDYTVENVDHELFFGFDYTNPNMTD